MKQNNQDRRRIKRAHTWKRMRNDRALYLMLVIPMAFIFVFRYIPISGLYISFTDYDIINGIFNSPFVGLKWFKQFFGSANFSRLLRNSLQLSVYTLLITFPAPIILSISLNEVKHTRFKNAAQTVSYLPYFISTVVVVGIMAQILSPTSGIINHVLNFFGMDSQYFMSDPRWFRALYIMSDVWQTTGWTAIVYIAAITSISDDLYEAAQIDGAGRIARILHVTLPGILPMVIIMFLLKVGHCMELGYEKVLLMYSPQTMEVADIFDTFVYRRGIGEMDYSFGTAVGLFKSVVSFILVVGANRISNKLADVGLW